MVVIKRDGREATFEKSKIKRAISRAFADVERTNPIPNSDEIINKIADRLVSRYRKRKTALSVEEIQDNIETELMKEQVYDVAKAYIRYRHEHEMARNNSRTDGKILTLVDGANESVIQENSNKNPIILSTQRDYMAGEVSKDITNRVLLPKEIVDAHEAGIIHFHDADYYAQHMHNCFSGYTRFITIDGVRQFNELEDGCAVTVLTKDNEWREATVHYFGKQHLNTIVFGDGTVFRFVDATANHRWILENGDVTTDLKVGDKLYHTDNKVWTVLRIHDYGDEGEFDVWCVTEPVTHSFTLDGGIVTGNCDLVNLEDMLQNGTAISGTMIEKPHSFSTACNIATQIIAQVASNQYGGQSISLAHLAPFVDISRKAIREDVKREFETMKRFGGAENTYENEEQMIDEITEERVRDEVKKGVQTIQYQVVTLMTTNGQAPFITVFMYLNEVEDGRLKDDLAMIIEEVVRQRIKGVKNEKGVWITPAFPKLIYVLEPDNITEDSKYWYLTRLCAECSVRRMVPDYISEKKMLELKIDQNGNGQCYTCINKSCA